MDFPTIAISLITLILLGLLVNSVANWFRKKRLKNDIFNLLNDLNFFSEELNKYQNHHDPVNGIVPFFQETSRWYDQKDKFSDLIDECIKFSVYPQTKINLINLRRLIVDMGRNKHENRTETGQIVTDNDVYLGEIHGLNTKNISYLREHREKLEIDEHPSVTIRGENASVWQIYEDQARSLMNSNSKHLSDLIIVSKKIFLSES